MISAEPNNDGDSDAPQLEVSGHLKWFNYVKGYGFVTADDGRDVFLHLSCLRKAGLSFIEEGSEITCSAVQGPRGLQATSVIQVRPITQAQGGAQQQQQGAAALAPEMQQAGGSIEDQASDALNATVKWFNKIRGYGFLTVENTPSDIFLHIEVLRRCGVSTVLPGQKLKVTLEEGDKGLSAQSAYLVQE